MTEQDGGSPPRLHPEDPAEGPTEDAQGREEPDVPRRHAQQPAEGAQEAADEA